MSGTRHQYGIKQHEQRRKRDRQMRCLITIVAVCIVLILAYMIAGVLRKKAVLTLQFENVAILQGEDVPTLKAKVKVEKDDGPTLDKKSKYTSKDFIRDLKKGKGYKIICKVDPKTEGSYKATIKLSESLQKKLDDDWSKKIQLTVKDGKVRVKNKVGRWEKNKFKRYDGTYVKSDFVVSRGDTYYFDENGKMATGWHTIKSTTYYFNKKGIMQTGWQKNGSDKYYMTKSGGAVTGWQKIGKNTYYFENDGKMVTGEVNIGLSVCKFDKKGNLISKKAGKVDPKKPMVALTFDDGPGPRTLELLKALEKYNAHATFFMVGQNVSIHKDALKKMKEIGCELGNHSYNHANLSKQDAKGLKDQVDKTNDLIKGIVGRGATVLRPPYGAIGGVMHEKVKMPMILWNIDTLDWKTRNAQKTIETVMNNVGDGDIVLMHDIHTESVDAALKLVPKLEKEGYQLVTISEMAEAKGQKLENGEKYCDFTAKTLSRAKENQESEE